MSEQPQITVPDMCQKHQALLCRQAGYSPRDPWRALVVMAQIALFQAMTVDDSAHERTGGEITKFETLGCFACYKPDAFGEIVEAAKSRDPGAIKALGERWVADGAARSKA